MDDNGNLNVLEKQAGDPAEQSLQDRFHRERENGGYPLLAFLAIGGNLIAPWWSKRRDQDLAAFWPKSGHLSGAFYTLACKLSSVPRHVLPRDPSVSAHRKLADQYQIILDEMVEGMGGWEALIVPTLLDRWTQDNGWFWEVTGDGPKDGPIRGMATGLMHLDAWRCDRTGDYEFPVVYTDTDGRRYRLHTSRVIFDAELSDPRVDMLGVGHCWVSRIIDTAQNLVDIAQYKQEKLGSRPKRAIAITKGGLDPEDLATALRLADNQMTAAGLSRYSKMVIVGDRTIQNADISMLDLASLPDGFDENESTTLAMNLIALTGGVPTRWLWPASVTGATKADAEYQHVAGLTGGPGSTLARFANLLGGPPTGLAHVSGKFLPPSLKLEFDFQDDYQDYSKAQNQDLRSQSREREVNDGVITIRVAREQALDAGDITDAQFVQMELDDGRLENGAPILSLFAHPEYKGLLDVGVADPLDVGANDKAVVQAGIVLAEAEVMRLVAAPRNPAEGRQAKEALGALGALKELYKSAPKPKPVQPFVEVEGNLNGTPPENVVDMEEPEGWTTTEDEEVTPEGEVDNKQQEYFVKSFEDAHKTTWTNGGMYYKEPCPLCLRLIEPGKGKLIYEFSRFKMICQEHNYDYMGRTQSSAGPFEVKSVQSFGLSVRAAARGYWSGQTDFFSFVNTLISAVMRGYEQAWREGAAVYGVQPGDRTPEEQAVLDGMINQAQSRVTAFADFVARQTKAQGGYWRDVLPRADLWTEQYEAVRARAQAMASSDVKEVWRYGDTVDHCESCSSVQGRVYRGSVWNKYGWYPKSTALACHGYRCDCKREKTDLPITRGHPPMLRG